jgi:hypothetical protein
MRNVEGLKSALMEELATLHSFCHQDLEANDEIWHEDTLAFLILLKNLCHDIFLLIYKIKIN